MRRRVRSILVAALGLALLLGGQGIGALVSHFEEIETSETSGERGEALARVESGEAGPRRREGRRAQPQLRGWERDAGSPQARPRARRAALAEGWCRPRRC